MAQHQNIAKHCFKVVVLTRPISDRVFQSATRAFRATSSKTGSPVRWLRVENSRMNVPTPAVQVIGVSVGLTPLSRFTVPYGIPVGVWNAREDMLTMNLGNSLSYTYICNVEHI